MKQKVTFNSSSSKIDTEFNGNASIEKVKFDTSSQETDASFSGDTLITKGTISKRAQLDLLKSKIDSKENKNNFIFINSEIIPDEDLEHITTELTTKIFLGNVLYYLCSKNGNIFRYATDAEADKFLVINTNTGVWETESGGDDPETRRKLEEHINNNDIHTIHKIIKEGSDTVLVLSEK